MATVVGTTTSRRRHRRLSRNASQLPENPFGRIESPPVSRSMSSTTSAGVR